MYWAPASLGASRIKAAQRSNAHSAARGEVPLRRADKLSQIEVGKLAFENVSIERLLAEINCEDVAHRKVQHQNVRRHKLNKFEFTQNITHTAKRRPGIYVQGIA